MTNQEIIFANEFVFIKMNSEETDDCNIAVKAAKVAEYELTSDHFQNEAFAMGILNGEAVKEYVDLKMNEYHAKMQPDQRRTLWDCITNMSLGTPSDWEGHGCIDTRK